MKRRNDPAVAYKAEAPRAIEYRRGRRRVASIKFLKGGRMRKIIDLNYEPKERKQEDQDYPLGILILAIFPFSLILWYIFTAAMLAGG